MGEHPSTVFGQMASEGVWKTVRGKLSVASGDEFERTALHYLRATWPKLIQAPRLQRLDRFGVDLCEPASDGHYAVVVQAKGFKVDEQLLDSQVKRQILPSVEKFRRSPLTCGHYVLLHNREGADRELAREIQGKLDRLVAEGKAKHATLWDRDRFIKDTRNQIDRRIRDKLKARSEKLLREHQRFFHFGELVVSTVPLSRSTWEPGSLVRRDIPEAPFVDEDAASLITASRRVRYAILIGAFGIGKTTTVLRAVGAKDRVVIYVPAHTIRRERGSQGTNYLLRNLNDELDLLDDLPSDTAEVLHEVIGAAIGRVLRQPNEKFVLVIDGLDEHSFYGTAHGLVWLTNELAELRCPIVLATRKEHFLSLIGNYEIATETLSRKGGEGRIVDLFELGAWSPAQARELVERALPLAKRDRQVAGIRGLLGQLSSASPLSAALLGHPLFLQMSLDLIMEGEESLVGDEDKLVELWVRRKIRRDLTAPRLEANVRIDAEHYIGGMLNVMAQVAAEIAPQNKQADVPSGSIDIGRVLAIAREVTGIPELDEATILTTSLLVPAARRRDRVLRAKFFHQVFLDFFLKRGTAF